MSDLRMHKLQQFFSKSNIYQNNSIQQIERQKLTISNDVELKDQSQIEEKMIHVVRPQQTDFDQDMYLMAKPLIQPLIQLNIVSKPEINNVNLSHQLHNQLDKAIKRSENFLTLKKQPNNFLNQLRQQNKQNQLTEKKQQNQAPAKEIKQIDSNDYDFKTINKRPLPDQTTGIKLPKSIKDIYQIGQTADDLQANDESFLLKEEINSQQPVTKIDFDCLLNIAAGQVDEHTMAELVKNVIIAKKKELNNPLLNSSVEQCDVSVEAYPIKQDQYVQMSSKALPSVQTVLNGIRLAKNQYYQSQEKLECKAIIRSHLEELMQILMQGYPEQSGMSQSLDFLLSLNKSELAVPYEGMSKLELLYIFVNEYKALQMLEQAPSSQNQFNQTISKRYLKPTKAAQMKTIKKK
ncbi:unnamed protein product (macronuclear) [Paramecium tetraurelia]|uniref:Uncharacterized protein n=1 Tax=Paramecium tetraurelia TaxID=5888 RepID=A0CDG8_PARTE|nr:uncharacterized protein GSPATT00007046001 [Paramecium tetraurelia]CAK68835.1 unnamed protein product [Paramecium tetraurelia]|eukprot:XP_001436232.1 hypothetical protein (macronuclear) [Paramecium tetraurelia strain d4-2]